MTKLSLSLTENGREVLMDNQEFTVENLQKWLNEGEAGLPYVFFALFNQMNTNQAAVNQLLEKQDKRLYDLEECIKDVKPVTNSYKSITWFSRNWLGLIGFVISTVNFYILIKSMQVFSTVFGKGATP